jgi:hypothetical protein
MKQHREKKNQMNWPHLKTKWICKEYNRRKNRKKVPRGRPRGNKHGKSKEESTLQEIPGSKRSTVR